MLGHVTDIGVLGSPSMDAAVTSSSRSPPSSGQATDLSVLLEGHAPASPTPSPSTTPVVIINKNKEEEGRQGDGVVAPGGVEVTAHTNQEEEEVKDKPQLSLAAALKRKKELGSEGPLPSKKMEASSTTTATTTGEEAALVSLPPSPPSSSSSSMLMKRPPMALSLLSAIQACKPDKEDQEASASSSSSSSMPMKRRSIAPSLLSAIQAGNPDANSSSTMQEVCMYACMDLCVSLRTYIFMSNMCNVCTNFSQASSSVACIPESSASGVLQAPAPTPSAAAPQPPPTEPRTEGVFKYAIRTRAAGTTTCPSTETNDQHGPAVDPDAVEEFQRRFAPAAKKTTIQTKKVVAVEVSLVCYACIHSSIRLSLI